MAAVIQERGARPRYTCVLCGAEWRPKGSEPPQRCPRCHSTRWRDAFVHQCARCGYRWASRGRNPFKCPECQTLHWREVSASLLPKEEKIPILLRYDSGMGCIEIARELGITFEKVFDTVLEAHPGEEPRV